MTIFAIIGSRPFDDIEYAANKLDEIISQYDSIVSGGAKGADSIGAAYADINGLPLTVYKPDWKKYGKGAGFIRNKLIIDECDVVIAFWDGSSKGTKHSINLARKSGKEVIILKP